MSVLIWPHSTIGVNMIMRKFYTFIINPMKYIFICEDIFHTILNAQMACRLCKEFIQEIAMMLLRFEKCDDVSWSFIAQQSTYVFNGF